MTTETLEKANRLNGRIRHIKSEIDQLSSIRKGNRGLGLGIMSAEDHSFTSHFSSNPIANVSKEALNAALCAMLNDLESKLRTLEAQLTAL